VAQDRRRWRRRQGGIDPSRLVFLDESAIKTNMTKQRGRCPHGHWRATTVIVIRRIGADIITLPA
jgi:hypothetical protein